MMILNQFNAQLVTNLDSKQLCQIYSQEQYDQLSYIFIRQLEEYNRWLNASISESEEYALINHVNQFLKHLLYFITQEDFIINDKLVLGWLSYHGTIANLLRISRFKNAEVYLALLQTQQQNFIKLLSLYSASNEAIIAPKLFFDLHPQLACVWYANYLESWMIQLANSKGYFNLRQHLRCEDERLTDLYAIENLYFGVTYIDSDQEAVIKTNLNQKIQSNPLFKNFQNQLNQNLLLQKTRQQKNNKSNIKIAVISGCWLLGHSVHRNYAQYVRTLQKHFSVTLVHLGAMVEGIDQAGFGEVLNIHWQEQSMDISELLKHQFDLIFFPDIGMSTESILLSNLRIAPIQVMGLGHPSSSWSQQIDYVITGRKVELPSVLEANQKPLLSNRKSCHYIEKLIILPSLGVSASIHPHMTQLSLPSSGFKLALNANSNANSPSSNPSQSSDTIVKEESIIINCPWYPQKVNYPMLLILNRIRQGIKQPCIFRFFAGAGLRKLHQFLAFKNEIIDVLGAESCQFFSALKFEDYATYLNQGHITLDSYPFGGFNVIIDSLAVGVPAIVWQGNHWYNRAAAQCLREIGLNDLIATNAQEYISITTKLAKSIKQKSQFAQQIKAKLKPQFINQINHQDDSEVLANIFYDLIKSSADEIM